MAVGENWLRKTIHTATRSITPNINFVTITHPWLNIIKNVKFGKGVLAGRDFSVSVEIKIGNISTLNTNLSINHDSRFGSFSF